jgi:hypothetical protein
MACNPLQIEREKLEQAKHLTKDKEVAEHVNKPGDTTTKEDARDPRNQSAKLPRRPEKHLPVP